MDDIRLVFQSTTSSHSGGMALDKTNQSVWENSQPLDMSKVW